MNTKMRICLGCGDKFLSKHIGNRICGKCGQKNCKIFMKRSVQYTARSRSIRTSE